jgi:demethylmenaquinone methyltransferase/2-methoxy-6-polyprenyl-1,4-benzoquinol methylase
LTRFTFTYLLRYVADPAATVAELACGEARRTDRQPRVRGPNRAWWRIAVVLHPHRRRLPMITGGRAWYRVGRFLGPSIDSHYRTYPVDWTINAE